MIIRSLLVLFGFLAATELSAQQQVLVANRANEIGRELDKIADQLLTPSVGQIAEFEILKEEVSQVFFSIPSIMQLVAVQDALESRVDQVTAAGEFQVSMSIDGGNRNSSGSSDGRTDSQSITASKILMDFGSLASAIAQVKSSTDSTRFEIEIQRSNVLLEMIQARLALHTSQQKLSLARSFFDTRLEFQDFIIEKKELGVSSEADVIRAQAKTYEAQSALPAAYQALQDANDTYFEIYGIEAPEGTEFDMLQFDPFKSDLVSLVSEHPLVLQSESDKQVAVHQLESYESGDNGSFNFQATGSRGKVPNADSESRLDIKIIYERTLGDGGSRDAQKRLYRASVNEYEHSVELTRRTVTRAIQSARNALIAAEAELAAQVETLKAVRQANVATKDLFIFNRGSLTDVFQIQEEYLRAAQSVVEAKAAVQRRYYELLHQSNLLLMQFELGV